MGRHDTHEAGACKRRCWLERGLNPDDRYQWVNPPQGVNGGRGCRIAGNDQRLDPEPEEKVFGNSQGALLHIGVALLPIGSKSAVGVVDKIFAWQLAAQGPQNAQATDAAVENTNRRMLPVSVSVVCFCAHAWFRAMPLNSPDAMRLCHSAGPVMWALVPPASTATVTGMSTTSNS